MKSPIKIALLSFLAGAIMVFATSLSFRSEPSSFSLFQLPIVHGQVSVYGPEIAGRTTNPYVYAFDRVTVSTTAVGFTAGNYNPPNLPSVKCVMFTVEAQPIRYQYNAATAGGLPTATTGHTAAASDIPYYVCGPNNIRQFRAIRSGGTDAILNISYLY